MAKIKWVQFSAPRCRCVDTKRSPVLNVTNHSLCSYHGRNQGTKVGGLGAEGVQGVGMGRGITLPADWRVWRVISSPAGTGHSPGRNWILYNLNAKEAIQYCIEFARVSWSSWTTYHNICYKATIYCMFSNSRLLQLRGTDLPTQKLGDRSPPVLCYSCAHGCYVPTVYINV